MPKLPDAIMWETLPHWAFDNKQLSFFTILPLFALVIIPSVIAIRMLSKDKRLHVEAGS